MLQILLMKKGKIKWKKSRKERKKERKKTEKKERLSINDS